MSISGWENPAIPFESAILLRTFVAICLGALVGLERQVAQGESDGEKDFPGVRTFAFTALLGALAVLVSHDVVPWFGVALFAALTTFLVMRYRYDASTRDDPGYTTEIASLCTFAVGVLAQSGHESIAVILTIAMVALLRSKRVLHQAGELLSPLDMETLIRFLVISGIVLPLLPDEPIEEFFGVLRPRDVWRMVVLISGVSFAGYVLMRLRASHSGHLVMGLLGGLVSSTAAALAYTRSARHAESPAPFESMVVLAACASFVRISFMLGLVGPAILPLVLPALGTMCAVSFALGVLWHRPPAETGKAHDFGNPLTMKFALAFGGIYAAVLLLVAGAREFAGPGAIYVTSSLAALIGADAPSLSLTRLAVDGHLDLPTAATAIVAVAISTTLGKAGIVCALGRGTFVPRVAGSLCITAAAGAAVLYASLS